MNRRMAPELRREAIVDAALVVARRRGLGGTGVREVAAELGVSSGLIHHYFESMDALLAAAFERVARADFDHTARAVRAAPDPVAALEAFFRTYSLVGPESPFQLWLDAWAEASRRPAIQAVSRELNVAWQQLIETVVRDGVASGRFRADDPGAAAWRILSVLDGLALQVVAHASTIAQADVLAWSASAAELELGLERGTLRRHLRG